MKLYMICRHCKAPSFYEEEEISLNTYDQQGIPARCQHCFHMGLMWAGVNEKFMENAKPEVGAFMAEMAHKLAYLSGTDVEPTKSSFYRRVPMSTCPECGTTEELKQIEHSVDVGTLSDSEICRPCIRDHRELLEESVGRTEKGEDAKAWAQKYKADKLQQRAKDAQDRIWVKTYKGAG